ncbi:hypothetical protein yc1106_07866 [Curvularia clavata]|uniref:Aminoglycoside phosphotransferase domain-containing protein n=1 Tax=Curvularia clavata TaxID=95742 RepID=A0A9Q8ZCC6_CURCL|nr:hypothetical protein yc1106_07866 [Curvularia clavata]
MADCLELEKMEQLTAMTFDAVPYPLLPVTFAATVITKIVRFEWELPRIEQETRAYQLLEGSGLASCFLSHINENRRIIGVLLEKIEGCSASFQGLGICETAPGKLHELRFVHGDANQYNFLVTEDGVKFLDFERLQRNPSPDSVHKGVGERTCRID